MKYKSFLYIAAILAFFAFQVMVQSGCRRENLKSSLQQIDSLENWAADEQGLLNIDDAAIKQRFDSMNIKINFVGKNIKMVITDSLKNSFGKYLAIRSNYKNFLVAYPGLEYDCEQDKQRIDNLKHDYINHAISENQFQQYYIKEKDNVLKRLNGLDRMARSITGIRMDFDRTDDVMTATYNALVAKLKPTVQELKEPLNFEKNKITPKNKQDPKAGSKDEDED